ncbi:lysostaphin resistance A-like protein [Streptomyces violascens]|uniref:lysostaphin resistance A-like protein n=1 Tax=Streptomyces violascens TaxID=67381 RepID=UPI00378FF780
MQRHKFDDDGKFADGADSRALPASNPCENPELARRRRGFILFYAVLFTADAFLGQLARMGSLPFTHGLEYPPWTLPGLAQWMLLDLIVFAGMLALLGLRVTRWERRPLHVGVGMATNTSPGHECARGYTLGIAMCLFSFALTAAIGWIGVSGHIPLPSLTACIPLWGIITMFQAGVEEVIFRGWMLPLSIERWGPGRGVLTQAVLFAGLHLLVDANTGLAVLHALAFGLFAGFYAYQRKSLWGTIGIHSAYNFSALLLSAVSSAPLGPEGWQIVVIALTAAAIIPVKKLKDLPRIPR